MHNQFKTQKFKHLMLAMGPRDLNSAPYHGGATTTGPDATHPPTICQNSGGGGGGVLGGSAGGCRGGILAVGGGFSRWGGLRATQYYHMHTSWGGGCLGVWGYGGMYAIIALSRPCREESLKSRRVAPLPPPPSPLPPSPTARVPPPPPPG